MPKLHLINDHHVELRVVDSFDPYDWIILCTIRTIDLSIRKLHLINDHHVERKVVDSFDPYDWIIVCTIRTLDLSIRKLHSLTVKSEKSRHNSFIVGDKS